MPEHVHLLLSEPPTHPLSTVLGALKRSVSKQLPQSPFWLSRYHDFNLCSPGKRLEKLRYLHRNPVAHGLIPTPAAYLWPGFRTHLTHLQSTVHITLDLPSHLPEPMTPPGAPGSPEAKRSAVRR